MATRGKSRPRSVPPSFGNGECQTLRYLIEQYRLERITDLNRFTSADLREEFEEGEYLIKSLLSCHAIQAVGTREIGPEGNTREVNLYGWRNEVAEWIEDETSDRAELPCGCRAHVHKRDGEFSCKFCADSDRQTPTFDRETVEEAMRDD